MTSEFDLIRRHFTRPVRQADLAVGDDAALLTPRPGMQLVVSTDMLVAGTHFLPDADPEDLGWKALAVNISDLAAMGAEPRWAVLSLALPGPDEAWIAALARGFFACAEAHGLDLVGGDTTRGPLNLCPTVFGELPRGQAILRSGALPGDDLWISGQPGRAALGLTHLRGQIELAPAARDDCLHALHRPQPRLALGLGLRGLARGRAGSSSRAPTAERSRICPRRALLDVSDGLLGDLGHILERSAVGALLLEPALPLAPLLAACGDVALARRSLLAGGDDYELLFAAPPARRDAVAALGQRLGLALHRIGLCTERPGELLLQDAAGALQPLAARGYDHFA